MKKKPVKKKPVNKPMAITSQRALTDLKRKIVESYTTAEKLSKSARDKANAAVAEAILCGEYLTKAKGFVGHSGWLVWLKKNCKGVQERTAQR